jgi:hypothetical protein
MTDRSLRDPPTASIAHRGIDCEIDDVQRSSLRGAADHHVCVMLHLRSLYVSKAAILTISMPQASVENRSPA